MRSMYKTHGNQYTDAIIWVIMLPFMVKKKAFEFLFGIGRSATQHGAVRGLLVLPAAYAIFTTNAYGQDFDPCDEGDFPLIETIENIYQLIFQVGPMLALIAAAVSFTMMSISKSSDKKSQWREYRNDALLWGVLGLLSLDVIVRGLMNLTGNGDCLGDTFF